jgi:hypothetical protein
MLDARFKYNFVLDRMVMNMDIAVVIEIAYSGLTAFNV